MSTDHDWIRNLFRGWLVVPALACLSLNVSAGTITKDTAGFGTTYTTGVYRYGDATNLPSVPQTNSTIATGGANSGSITVNGGADGSPQASTASKAPIPESGGRSVPVEAKAKIPKPSAGMAIAKFAAKLAVPISTGMAIKDLLDDLNLLSRWEGGKNNIYANDLKDPECAPSAQSWYVNTTGWCQTKVSGVHSSVLFVDRKTGGICYWFVKCFWTINGQNGESWYDSNNTGLSMQTAYTPDPALTPLTEQQVADKIAAKSGWPTSYSRALVDAIKAGETVPHDPPTVSGPASVAGPTTTKQEPATKTNPDGTVAKDAAGNPITGTKTTTTATTYNTTYTNNEVKITNNTTNTYTWNFTDGTTKTEQDTAQTEAPTPEPEKDACEANPDRVGCAKLDTPEGQVPKADKNVNFTAENMGWGSGSCPTGPTWSDSLGSHTINLQPICDKVSAIVRPLVLAFAALMALAIVVPGFRGFGED